MNMGGMSLSTLDLVAARVAKVSQEPLYDRILQHLSENKKYNMKMNIYNILEKENLY